MEGLSEEKLNTTYPAEGWSINGILGHVVGAEHWYMECLRLAFPRAELPEELQGPFRIKSVHSFLQWRH